MPKSSHPPRPGDSSTEFHDAEGFSVDPRLTDEETVDEDSGETVFFDVDEPLDENELVGETIAMTGREADEPGSDESASSAGSPKELDLSDMLNAAPVYDDEPDERPASGTGLTAVGFPSFDDPPENEEKKATSTGASTPPASTADVPPMRSRSLDDTDVAIILDSDTPQADSLPVVDVLAVPTATTGTKQRTLRKDDAVPRKSAPHRASVTNSREESRRRLMLILLASYASAVTLALGWLWMNRQTAQPHELESLPDVAPLDANEFRYVPQSAVMPPGHTLPLGGRQQLGFIEVEPLRVTRDPVEFTHYENPGDSRPPTVPVLKLWVRFTNVSKDQLIAPLDATLLFTRSYQSESDTILSNQLLLPADKAAGEAPAYMLDHPLSSEWDLKDQRLGYRLKPGESMETYVPVDPASTNSLMGDLVWRLHFRKGYNPQTGHGVTTMVEIPFDASQVVSESSSVVLDWEGDAPAVPRSFLWLGDRALCMQGDEA